LGSYCMIIERAIGLKETLPDCVFSILINNKKSLGLAASRVVHVLVYEV
jgi:hypothetical protein